MPDNSDVIIKKASPGTLAHRSKNSAAARQGTVIDTDLDAPKRIGLIVAGLVFGVFGLWSVTAPIEGAAHAQGQVTVRSFKKPVQHLEGGIIKAVHVKDGDRVQAGDVLIEMDNTQSLSQLEILNSQLKAHLALEARLIAERDRAPSVTYPSELLTTDKIAATEMQAQTQIFQARKNTHDGEVAVLQQRIGQLGSRITGMKAVQASKTELASSFRGEVKDFQALLAEGFADKVRLRELERNLALASGEAAEITTTIASAEMQIGETKLEILQLQNRIQSEVTSQLSEEQTRIQDLRERLTALTDIVSRTEVRAPESGIVNGLKVHTQGTVVGPGAILAEIVPQTDELLVDAQVSPLNIDTVAVGQTAKVRMSAFNSRTTPTLYGTVISLSADTLPDHNGAPYYLARIELKPESLEDLHGQVLVPGMPAEIFITTGSHTFLQYLFKPLSDSAARSFREE